MACMRSLILPKLCQAKRSAAISLAEATLPLNLTNTAKGWANVRKQLVLPLLEISSLAAVILIEALEKVFP